MDANIDSYEYLEVDATVINMTDWNMELKTAHIEWGKFDEGHSPISVPRRGTTNFSARGRSGSPSGTEGYAAWSLEGHPEAPTITAYFCNPAIGKCKAGIDCVPACITVAAKGASANKFVVTYIIG